MTSSLLDKLDQIDEDVADKQSRGESQLNEKAVETIGILGLKKTPEFPWLEHSFKARLVDNRAMANLNKAEHEVLQYLMKETNTKGAVLLRKLLSPQLRRLAKKLEDGVDPYDLI